MKQITMRLGAMLLSCRDRLPDATSLKEYSPTFNPQATQQIFPLRIKE